MRVLLVSPPWRIPSQGTLSIATLRPLLEAAGHEVGELHGSMLFPAADSNVLGMFMGYSRYAFGRALGDRDVATYAAEVLRCQLGELNSHTAVTADENDLAPKLGFDHAVALAQITDSIQKADVCLDRCVARALETGPYDIIGFSTMFDDQLPAAVVIARRLKLHWPTVKIAFGGPACFEEQADGLLATFPEIDAICHAEGEDVVVPLVNALGGRGALGDVPGIAFRDGDQVRRTESPPLLRDMDRLPMPDYSQFIAQLSASEWESSGAQLFYETSRGCWWGQKSLCTFCGLNGGGITYRSKSPKRAYDEIVSIYRAYPTVNSMLATDNILDLEYLKEVFPRLAHFDEDKDRPLRLFYEVKSNMRRDQVEVMSAGGVRGVQPGIESFSDQILEVMRKGCTALGQVQFIKWAHQSGAEPFYNVLVLNPGEDTSAYRAMLELVPFLTHLPHPQAVVTMLLERFSPYFSNPEAYGIVNVRPKPFYKVVFGAEVDRRLAYQFDYDHPMFSDETHLAAVRTLVGHLRNWQTSYRPDTLFYVEDVTHVDIVDTRDTPTRTTLTGPAVALFRFLDQHRTRAAIERAFPDLAPEVLEATLEMWLYRRWICRVDDRYLSVVPRKGPHPIRELTMSREITAPRELVRLKLVS
jgi:ribosomal peptide maturation radical SAM protein 1